MSVSLRCIRSLSLPAKSAQAKAVLFQSRCCHTRHLFDELSQRDVYSLNRQLTSYAHKGNFIAVWDLFFRIQCACFGLDAYTFTPVLAACAALPGEERGKQVHGLMIKMGTDMGTVTKTALLKMYQKYGYLGDSVRVFEEIEFKDVVTWNAMLSSFLKHGLAKEALGTFGKMMRDGVEFSEFTLCSVLQACTSVKSLHLGKQVHGVVVVIGRDLVFLGTALIDFYSAVGHISEAVKVFSSLSSKKDYVMFNSMIAGCVKNKRYKEAFSLMSLLRPNAVALTTALAACSENADLWIGMQIHCVAMRFGFMSDTQLCNVLLDMYAKCGKILKARFLFDNIRCKDVVSWTSMIDAYGSHGQGCKAVELFKQMREVGGRVSPNSVTLLAVLSACGHSGLVEEGKELFFHLARRKYGIEPGVEHYCCFIDILGRAGRIEDAWCLFHDMVKTGVRPTPAIWAALVNACCLNSDFSRGEMAAKHLLESEPNSSSHYVLLSNFYASIGRWDVVDSLRNNMRDKELIKEAGSSWLTVAPSHGSKLLE